MRKPEEFLDRYYIPNPTNPIGEGAQSKVVEGVCRITKKRVAIKHILSSVSGAAKLPATPWSKRRCSRRVQAVYPLSRLCANFREIATLQRLHSEEQHPNIVSLVEVLYEDKLDGKLCIVFEHCQDTLASLMVKWRTASGVVNYSLHQVKYIFRQILTGIQFVHSHLIVHRDLKPQNILITADSIVKIADFGLSKCCSFPAPTGTVNVGSLWYKAPEVLLQAGYDEGMDLWALGCILGEMHVGQPLFPESCEYGVLMKIFKRLGTPPDAGDRIWPCCANRSRLWPQWNSVDAQNSFGKEMLPKMGNHAFELMMKFLSLDSNTRIRCGEAVNDKYFKRTILE